MPKFVRVRDKDTGHQIDVRAGDSRIGKSFEPLNDERYPDLDGLHARPRPALHYVDKAGQPTPPAPTPAAPALNLTVPVNPTSPALSIPAPKPNTEKKEG